jgi:hypothetical protein
VAPATFFFAKNLIITPKNTIAALLNFAKHSKKSIFHDFYALVLNAVKHNSGLIV